jgi:peptide/nickel transport system ATP-binding protein
MMIDQRRDPTLSVRGLRITLKRTGKDLVRGVSFDVQPGKVLALVGESGSGKTMIGRSILRLLPDGIATTAGDLLYRGSSILQMPPQQIRKLRGRSIGMVFQEPLVSLNPAMRIGKQMAEALRLHTDMKADEVRQRSIAMLRRIHIADPEGCLDAVPHQFSGGMRQRIMLASVMLLKPDLLIADEPTTALDTLSQLEVLQTMMELTRDAGTAVLLITHNLGLVEKYADDVVVLREGELIEAGPTATVLDKPASDYTCRLIDSVPRLAPRKDDVETTSEPILEAHRISVSFGNAASLLGRRMRKRVLNEVSLTIRKGETVAVVGGSGSSTRDRTSRSCRTAPCAVSAAPARSCSRIRFRRSIRA